MKNKQEEEKIAAQVEESPIISIADMFRSKDLLKDGSNLNVRVNPENHYFQHIHRLKPNSKLPFYYVITFDSVQYKGGPYVDIYAANRDCAAKLYELFGLDDVPVIECEKPKIKKDENNNREDIL